MAGLVTGVARMGVHFAYPTPTCGDAEDPRPEILTKVHYLHFAIILAAVTFLVTVCVSALTEPRKEKQVRNFYSSLLSKQSLENKISTQT